MERFYPAVDFLRLVSVKNFVREAGSGIIVNCAAHTAVDACENKEEVATLVNGRGPGLLAALAAEFKAVLAHVSTD